VTVRQQWGVIAVTLAVLAVGLYGFERAFGNSVQPVGVGVKAPAFDAHAVVGTGPIERLADYKGDVVILNVWATWCGPCRAEMPTLERLHKMFGPSGLKIVAVSVDQTASSDSVRAYARAMGLTFNILHDSTATIAQTYRVVGYPESYVIDRDGMIRKTWLGAADWTSEGNVALVRNLLGLPPSAAPSDSAPASHP